MSNGESTHVILLEYTEWITLAQLQNKYLSHKFPQYKPLPDELYTEWLHIAKELISYLYLHSVFCSNLLEQYVPVLLRMSTARGWWK